MFITVKWTYLVFVFRNQTILKSRIPTESATNEKEPLPNTEKGISLHLKVRGVFTDTYSVISGRKRFFHKWTICSIDVDFPRVP